MKNLFETIQESFSGQLNEQFLEAGSRIQKRIDTYEAYLMLVEKAPKFKDIKKSELNPIIDRFKGAGEKKAATFQFLLTAGLVKRVKRGYYDIVTFDETNIALNANILLDESIKNTISLPGEPGDADGFYKNSKRYAKELLGELQKIAPNVTDVQTDDRYYIIFIDGLPALISNKAYEEQLVFTFKKYDLDEAKNTLSMMKSKLRLK
jgi:hypothetical protein